MGTFNQMAFSIEKTSVVAQTRALKAEYTVELAQDLKSVHGLDAEAELSNILSQEIINEMNREVMRTVYNSAQVGAQVGSVCFRALVKRLPKIFSSLSKSSHIR